MSFLVKTAIIMVNVEGTFLFFSYLIAEVHIL